MRPERSLHRVPISWAWRLLVDAGDKSVRWSVGRDGSFPLPRILAAHIAGCLPEAGNVWDSVIIAIPNDLDEFGQDGLLRALRDLKIQSFQQEKVRLIWRPVAAALAWTLASPALVDGRWYVRTDRHLLAIGTPR